ncbi:peroxiredoxin family protein [Deinococcus multiflagellatus]|uniref:peroxiredoxin family protein n=1 Tax=Deinococcus multiflagellatus TaxID=1656887 RepID=UPI001CCA84E4|nr:TlpA disulfide reductase family protein [Deinococcus multiflagellatus]MBZ9712817.1 TlpA family protein disulfide reductase [Deinococcus multiflagellatus]
MDWPAPPDFVHGHAVPPPAEWPQPGLVMTFNLECPGCVSRGIPFLKRLHAEFGAQVQLLAVHTSFGHRLLPREAVEPTLVKFARDFAKLPFPVALDLSGDLARAWQTEGTPHWLAFAPGGELRRSVYGSQENAQTRLQYLLEEWSGRQGG